MHGVVMPAAVSSLFSRVMSNCCTTKVAMTVVVCLAIAQVCARVSWLLLCLFEQVLDLSSNEFSAEGVGVIADATRNAAGLRQLRLLGNKIPFGLDTLRKLMQVGALCMDQCWAGSACILSPTLSAVAD
jgi:uncharacterized membrane protein